MSPVTGLAVTTNLPAELPEIAHQNKYFDKDANSSTTTNSLGGLFKTNSATRKEFLLGLQQV